MRKASGKRLPHGATAAMVLQELLLLHGRQGRRLDVSRAELLSALSLPETTVDDRLRTLVKQGVVLRVGRALYAPKLTDSTRTEQRGTRKTTYFPNGAIREEEWF